MVWRGVFSIRSSDKHIAIGMEEEAKTCTFSGISEVLSDMSKRKILGSLSALLVFG